MVFRAAITKEAGMTVRPPDGARRARKTLL